MKIKTLQNAPRDVEKLDRLSKAKEWQKGEAMHIKKIHEQVKLWKALQ